MEVERRACRAAGNGFFASVYAVAFQSPLVNSDIILFCLWFSFLQQENEGRVSVMSSPAASSDVTAIIMELGMHSSYVND